MRPPDDRAGRPDPFDLQRFEAAQNLVYPTVRTELQRGHKRTHWMWFIFPQFAGLGRSPTAQHYAIQSNDEARHYLAHPVLGPRLVECTQALLAVEGRSATAIFGSPDDLKLRSSMTLFAAVAPRGSVFSAVLDKYYQGQPDLTTLMLLQQHTSDNKTLSSAGG